MIGKIINGVYLMKSKPLNDNLFNNINLRFGEVSNFLICFRVFSQLIKSKESLETHNIRLALNV